MELTSIEGEAIANNRKAKLIFFYEWVINAKWRGVLNGQSDEVEGKIEIPNLSEENDPDEIDVNVTIKSEGFTSDILKDIMRIKGTKAIRDQLAKYISLLKTDFAKDLIKPTKDSAPASDKVVKETSKLSINNGLPPKPKPVSSSTPASQIEVKDLSLREEMKCRKEEVYRAFTELELVTAFTRGAAVVEATPGGKFAMFDGNITGTFTSLDTNNEIKQKWRFRSWPENHYSDVTITFEEKDDCTAIVVTQKGVPVNDFERTENGWRQFYFHSMKQTFGFGSMLY